MPREMNFAGRRRGSFAMRERTPAEVDARIGEEERDEDEDEDGSVDIGGGGGDGKLDGAGAIRASLDGPARV